MRAPRISAPCSWTFIETVEYRARLGGAAPVGRQAKSCVIEQRHVIIVDRGEPADDPSTNNVLVHELIHALQDADVHLSAFREELAVGYDPSLGGRAVVEGEARLHQTRLWAAQLGLARVDQMTIFGGLRLL